MHSKGFANGNVFLKNHPARSKFAYFVQDQLTWNIQARCIVELEDVPSFNRKLRMVLLKVHPYTEIGQRTMPFKCVLFVWDVWKFFATPSIGRDRKNKTKYCSIQEILLILSVYLILSRHIGCKKVRYYGLKIYPRNHNRDKNLRRSFFLKNELHSLENTFRILINP